MSLPDPLRKIGAELRYAVAGRQFSKIEALAREYRRCLDTLPADARGREEILRESAALFEEVRRMALAARASVAARLSELPTCAPAHYGAADKRTRSTWELRG
jgi:hypothetical protein